MLHHLPPTERLHLHRQGPLHHLLRQQSVRLVALAHGRRLRRGVGREELHPGALLSVPDGLQPHRLEIIHLARGCIASPRPTQSPPRRHVSQPRCRTVVRTRRYAVPDHRCGPTRGECVRCATVRLLPIVRAMRPVRVSACGDRSATLSENVLSNASSSRGVRGLLVMRRGAKGLARVRVVLEVEWVFVR